LLCSTSEGGLSEKVNQHLDQEWELYGSPIVAVNDFSNYHYQAMVYKKTTDYKID
jgi:hypothetical protein